ncbi:MAG: PKD domain-containing protein, partial [Amphritea sp.]
GDSCHLKYSLSTTNSDIANIKSRTRTGLATMYNNEPQFADLIGTENFGHAFVRHVAETTFSFTTFNVQLRDTTNSTDDQPDSELKFMFPSLREATGDTFAIDDDSDNEDIGFSTGHCGRFEVGLDFTEEWWPMENSNRWPCSRTSTINDSTLTLDGYAYIENSGGDGSNSGGIWDSLQPKRYVKELYILRYGTNRNSVGRSLLRIYGDVLYPTAVAYGAGLLQSFIFEVLNPPTAEAGGSYLGEACQPVDFDASDSIDQGEGSIVSYDWDFNGDGIYDLTTDSPFAQHTYAAPYEGQMVVQVTDNDGFIDSDSADVVVTPDVTPPDLSNMTTTPDTLWPPNHKMRTILIDPKADDACGVATCQIISVVSNESPDGRGSGHSHPDIKITGDLTLQLRAEREGTGIGRIYTVTVQCTDVNNNSSTGYIEVSVSHSRSNNAE